MSSIDLDLAGLDLREQQIEHDDAVRGAYVEAAGRRPGAETLDDAPVRPDLDGVGVGECHGDAPFVRCVVSRAGSGRRRAVRETTRMAAAQTSARAM